MPKGFSKGNMLSPQVKAKIGSIPSNQRTTILAGDGDDLILTKITPDQSGWANVEASGGNNTILIEADFAASQVYSTTGAGDDRISFSGANAFISSGAGNDTIEGVSRFSADSPAGQSGEFEFRASGGDNQISFVGTSTEVLKVNTGNSNDQVAVSGGSLELMDTGGNNRIEFQATASQFATVETGNGADDIAINSSRATVIAGGGDDRIEILQTEATGNWSVIEALSGNNQIQVISEANNSSTFINTGQGQDRLEIFASQAEISVGDGNDQVNAQQSGASIINGESGNDLIVAGAGGNQLQGGAGNDTLASGLGSDNIQGGAGRDILIGSQVGGPRSEIDTLSGGQGSDLYVLGDQSGSFYSSSGNDDYAVIAELGSGDRLQLFGQRQDYAWNGNQLLYQGDLVAQVEAGIPFDLSSNRITYVNRNNAGFQLTDSEFSPLEELQRPEINPLATGEGELIDNAGILEFSLVLEETLQRVARKEDITYRIAGGGDADYFSIDEISGELRFKQDQASRRAIARDADQQFEVVVEAQQNNGKTESDIDQQTLRISLNPETPAQQNTTANGGELFLQVEPRVLPTPNQVDEVQLLLGNGRANRLEGGNERDRILGKAGHDMLFGGGNADTLVGGLGKDTLNGNQGDDWLDGTNGVRSGKNEVDHLRSRSGADTFVLGNSDQVYYNRNNKGDRAIIYDLQTGKDSILLHGSADQYSLRQVGKNQQLLYQEDLVAFIKNTSNLSLDQPVFQFIGE